MSPEISERAFEETIECALLQHGPDACPGDSTAVRETPPPYGDTPPGGYRRRKPDDYDRTLCLLPHDVVDFMLATQPKEWKKLEQHHGAAVRERFLKRLATEIERRGALDVLRGGIKDSGCKFRLAYFRPASGLNEETRRLHAANLFAAVRQFIHEVEEDDEKGRKTGKRSLIFPRYQQLDCVRKLVTDARAAGAGRRYLIQHSAGSGKSFTIAWLAHQLATLHDADDRRVFDSIVVITDRRVLDRQLQTTMRQFEQTLGVVENIDSTSRQLKEALESGKTIIVTTLQKFPVIAREIGELPGKRFAVIVDEAHSSQSGESTKSLKSVLASRSLEDAEAEEAEAATPEEALEDAILAEMEERGRLPNLSTFAFTATPKPKTLELFGSQRPDGRFAPFHLYSMRQAIEEGFILDVLANYTTYKAYWRLLKKVEDDPRYDKRKAEYLLKSFVELHPQAIDKKMRIMVEHFAAQVLTFADADLEKLYVFARYLRRLLPPDRDELPREVQQNIDMESYRIQETSRSRIALERKAGLLDPVGTKGGHGTAPEGDFFVRSGPGTVKLPPDGAREYIRTRFSSIAQASDAPSTAVGDRQPGADDAPGDN